MNPLIRVVFGVGTVSLFCVGYLLFGYNSEGANSEEVVQPTINTNFHADLTIACCLGGTGASGTIKDENGEPVSGVEVTVRSSSSVGIEKRTSNAQGYFSTFRLGPCLEEDFTYTISAEKEGYAVFEVSVIPLTER